MAIRLNESSAPIIHATARICEFFLLAYNAALWGEPKRSVGFSLAAFF